MGNGQHVPFLPTFVRMLLQQHNNSKSIFIWLNKPCKSPYPMYPSPPPASFHSRRALLCKILAEISLSCISSVDFKFIFINVLPVCGEMNVWRVQQEGRQGQGGV